MLCFVHLSIGEWIFNIEQQYSVVANWNESFEQMFVWRQTANISCYTNVLFFTKTNVVLVRFTVGEVDDPLIFQY